LLLFMFIAPYLEFGCILGTIPIAIIGLLNKRYYCGKEAVR
jgi:hypothetical protein